MLVHQVSSSKDIIHSNNQISMIDRYVKDIEEQPEANLDVFGVYAVIRH